MWYVAVICVYIDLFVLIPLFLLLIKIKDSKVSVIKNNSFFYTTPKTATQQNNKEKEMVDVAG